MPILIEQPTRIEAAGNKPKVIAEYVGRVNASVRERLQGRALRAQVRREVVPKLVGLGDVAVGGDQDLGFRPRDRGLG